MKNIYIFLGFIFIAPALMGQIYTEDFENGIPENWIVEVTEGPGEWSTGKDMWMGLVLPSNSLVFNDDINGIDASASVAVATSPVIDLSGESQASLTFDIGNYILMENPKVIVEVFYENNWVQIYDVEGQYPELESELIMVTETLDVSEYISSEFKIRFVYDDDGDWAFGVAIDNVIVGSDLGITNLPTQSQISIYPNPVENHLHVVLGEIFSKSDSKLIIYDLNGKVVFESKYNTTNEYLVAHLPKGIYLLKVSDGKTKISKKIIKK